MNIEQFKKKIERELPESELILSSENDLIKLKKDFNGLPDDYLTFLKEVGSGTFGNCYFSIYSGPLEPDEIFDPVTASSLTDFIFIGDDFSGWMLAFDKKAKPFELAFFHHSEKHELNEKEQSSIAGFLNYELFER
ncbi:SMI1/KNR4 family protein [Vibrio vulnificus]|nr:SMI1/KNR4 family protein [Vibrio vulnificus]ELP6772812.1 SMI1/KNR4 family protein [Vibrio vulnificus]